jgi:hypothetical protein
VGGGDAVGLRSRALIDGAACDVKLPRRAFDRGEVAALPVVAAGLSVDDATGSALLACGFDATVVVLGAGSVALLFGDVKLRPRTVEVELDDVRPVVPMALDVAALPLGTDCRVELVAEFAFMVARADAVEGDLGVTVAVVETGGPDEGGIPFS